MFKNFTIEMKYSSSYNEEHIVLVQVNTFPVTIAVEKAATRDLATEKAAKNVLCMLKAMLLFTSAST